MFFCTREWRILFWGETYLHSRELLRRSRWSSWFTFTECSWRPHLEATDRAVPVRLPCYPNYIYPGGGNSSANSYFSHSSSIFYLYVFLLKIKEIYCWYPSIVPMKAEENHQFRLYDFRVSISCKGLLKINFLIFQETVDKKGRCNVGNTRADLLGSVLKVRWNDNRWANIVIRSSLGDGSLSVLK